MAFLVADVSAHQGDAPNFKALAAHPGMVGVIVKISEGVSYAPATWLKRNWSAAKAAGGTLRYGETWFRGAYHYLRIDVDGAKQADYFLDAIERAGGWGRGDMLPFVDAESSHNEDATAAQVIACVSAFARRVKERTGRGTIYYGRGFMRNLSIASRMGCVAVWNAGYTATMPMTGLAPAFSRDDVVLWQYTDGTNGSTQHKLPLTIPGFGGAVDLSVCVDGARKVTIGTIRRRLLGSVLDSLAVLALIALGAVLLSRVGGIA